MEFYSNEVKLLEYDHYLLPLILPLFDLKFPYRLFIVGCIRDLNIFTSVVFSLFLDIWPQRYLRCRNTMRKPIFGAWGVFSMKCLVSVS